MTKFLEGEPVNQQEQPSPFFKASFDAQYELALREGDRRFGTDCQHKETQHGVCKHCLRRVVTKK